MDLTQRPTAPDVQTADGPRVVRTGRRAPAWALLVGVVLAAVNLRTAVTSVGPLLDELETGIGLTSTLAGVLTTLPVISFAVLGSLTPRLAHRVGEQRLLAGALALMTAGLALRATVGTPLPFLALSVVALVGGAMGNVLLPVLVKRHFADRVGPMTAAYTTALAVGTTLAAAVSVPIATRDGRVDWRVGLGVWALLAGAAALCWLVLPAGQGGVGEDGAARVRVRLRGSRTAWALALFFGSQSLQAYVAFGWFALFFSERAGVSAARAGVLVAVLAAISIPSSIVIPSLAARLRSQRPLVAVLVCCYVIAYTGMLVAPRAGAFVWVVLVGVGSGAFPLALTLIGLRSRTPGTTSALSAFAQSIGYLLAAGGPLLVGVLHGADGSWTGPFALLFGALAVMAVSGWLVAEPRDVEDDLAAL